MQQALKYVVDKEWKFVLKDFNLNEKELLIRAKLPEDLFSRKQIILSTDEYFRLWRGLEETINNPAFPLLFGQMVKVEAFIPPIFAAFCSPDMDIAMARLSQYKKLIGPMILTINKEAGASRVTIHDVNTHNPLPGSLAAMELVFLVSLARLATRERIIPISVRTTGELKGLAEYTEFFGVMPVQGTVNELVFSAEDMKLPFLSENKAMWNFFEPQLRKRLAEMDKQASFVEKVRSCLFEMLPSGLCSSEDVAKKLAVSKRSLQRYLSEENTTFQQELSKTRERLAKHYLKDPSLSNAQISFLLGFSDPNSFVRAFHAWTGETPGKMRSLLKII